MKEIIYELSNEELQKAINDSAELFDKVSTSAWQELIIHLRYLLEVQRKRASQVRNPDLLKDNK